MVNKILEKSSKMLIKKSRIVLKDLGSVFLWGEPKLPDVLRKEYEKKNRKK